MPENSSNERSPGFLLAILPPGAFVGLAVLIALKNKLDALDKRKREALGIDGYTETSCVPCPTAGRREGLGR